MNYVKQQVPTHYQWLDLLRFLAAFAVLIAHARGFFLPEYSALPDAQRNIVTFVFYTCTRLGEEAVVFFFLLSGFLVGGRGIERLMNHTFNWKTYSVARFARIVPPLFGALLFIFISSLICYRTMPNIGIYAGNLFSLQGIFVPIVSGPFWSLAYEVWFYVILGGVNSYFITNKIPVKIFLLILLAFTAFIFTKLSAVYLFVWVMGAFVYFLRFENIKKRYWIMIALMLLFGVALRQMNSGSNAFEILQMPQSVSTLAFAFAGALFIAMLAGIRTENKIAVFISTTGCKLAVFSYTLYLTHYMVFRILQCYGVERADVLSFKSIAVYVVMNLIGIAAAYLLYLPFEKQTTKLKILLKKVLIKQNI